MNRNLKSTLLILIAALFALSAFSCASGTPDETTAAVVTGSPDDTGEATAEVTTGYLDHISETFGGETVRILYWSDRENPEYFAEQLTGAEVNDAIYRRNAKIESKLEVELDFHGEPGNSSKANDWLALVKRLDQAGAEEAYDIISAHSRSIGLCAYNGLTRDVSSLGSIDLSKPWWPSLLTQTCLINNQIHFISGDISTNMLYMMYAVFYNKDLLTSLNIEDPIDDVRAETWTIDRMLTLAKDVYSDSDADSVKSVGDRFGIVSSLLHCDALLYGSDIVGVENDGGRLALSESFTGERMQNLIEMIASGFAGSQDGFIGSGYKNIFKNGQSLFIIDRCDIAINDLDEKNFDKLSILPAPKYDVDQESYRTAIGNPFSLYAVPRNANNPEMSAAFLEVSAAESYTEVTPVIFEISMKIRYASDSNDSYCYDLIRAGAVYDPSRIFWKVFSSYGKAPDTLFQEQLEKGAAGWSGIVANNQKVLKSTIQKINKAFGLN
ncbi:MAG: hypothetical protein ILO42_02435 [Clostridia bacterium]|nr:hypothetical protein [Clostridia bacterium]